MSPREKPVKWKSSLVTGHRGHDQIVSGLRGGRCFGTPAGQVIISDRQSMGSVGSSRNKRQKILSTQPERAQEMGEIGPFQGVRG